MTVLGPGLAGWGAAVVELAPYEVAAWHFDGLAAGVPAGVTRLELADIAASGAGSVVELLERAGGVRFRSVTGNGVEGQPAMRGFGDNSGLRVLVLVDGQVWNNPDMSGLTWGGLDLDELEAVEILRGGQTVLYGNHAVAGVIKLESRRPGPELEGSLRAELGSDGRRGWSAGAGRQLGALGLRGGGSWYATDGYREHSAAEGGSARLGWRRDGNGLGRYDGGLRFERSSMEFPGPLTYEQMMENPRQSANDGGEEADNEEWQATLRGEGDHRHGAWQVVSGALARDRAWHLAGITAASRQVRGTLSPRIRWGGDTAFLMAGSDLGWDDLDYHDYLDEAGRIEKARARVERLTAGAYLFGSGRLRPGLEISGGIRHERAETDNRYVHFREEQLLPELVTNRGTFPNPDYRNPPEIDPVLSYDGPSNKSGWAGEISIMKTVADGFSIWAGWDRVYRYPALDETASYQGYPLSDPLNAGLEPETGNNFEAGLKRFGDNWHVSATAFLLLMEGEIAFDEAARLNRNIGDTRREGLELDAAYQTSHYGLSIRASWTGASLRGAGAGPRLPLVPEIETGLTAWLKPAEPLRLQAHARYYSDQFQGNDYANKWEKIPACALLDLSAEWQPSPWFSLAVTLSNVLDKIHAVSAYSGGFYPGPGRQVLVRARLTY